ncbi:unnamed protein product [Tilletia caries]|uniref:Uncharacterized protein n=2 Tax=Tilletia TaxID=13289 RepID=A0A8X7MQY5_9BASI|nr:hypothetical protein A4X06_0g5499 [Tilletia controversa]CAD6886558.1 unnamed protein product [Tilletia caries]CAD7060993.1 unnamed protein product [Tilletia caries]
MWTVMCILNTAAHSYATTTLIYGIGKHLTSKHRGAPLQNFKPLSQAAVPAPNSLASSPLVKIDESDSSSRTCAGSVPSLRPAVSFSRDIGNQEGDQGQIISRVFTFVERMQNRSISFFPSIRPSTRVVSHETRKATIVLAFFTLQSASRSGGLAFTADGLYMIVESYAASEANRFQPTWLIGYFLVVVTTLIAGTGSVISISRTTFEDSVAALVYAIRSNSSTVDEEEMRDTNFLDMEQTRREFGAL